MWVEPFSCTFEIIIPFPEQLKAVVSTPDAQGLHRLSTFIDSHSTFQMNSATWASQNSPLLWQYQYLNLSEHSHFHNRNSYILFLPQNSFTYGDMRIRIKDVVLVHIFSKEIHQLWFAEPGRNSSLFSSFFFKLTPTQKEILKSFFKSRTGL